MNDVTLLNGEDLFDVNKDLNSSKGNIYLSKDNDIYMLCCVDDKNFCLISLKDGNRWMNASDNWSDIVTRGDFVRIKDSIKIIPDVKKEDII